MGATALGRPSLALEHLEHLEHADLFRRQGIAFHRLRMRSLRRPAVHGDTRGGIGIMLCPGHGATVPIKKAAEAIAVGIAFAKAMSCDVEKTQLAFGFRWTKLNGRELVSWIEPTRHLRPIGSAYQDEVSVFIEVPLETPLSALGEYVNQAVKPLFEIFNGFELSKDVIEDLTRKTIKVG